MIDSIYQDSIDKSLDDQLIRPKPVAPPPPPGFSFGALAKAPAQGVGAAVAEGMAFGAEVSGAFGQVEGAMPYSAGGMFSTGTDKEKKDRLDATNKLVNQGIDMSNSVGDTFRQRAKDIMPDPASTHASAQIVAGLANFTTKAVGYTVTMGPAGPLALGGDVALTESDRLKQEGVDLPTRTKAGAVAGGLAAASVVVPMSGATATTRFIKGAAMGEGTIVGQSLAEKAILKAAGYDKIADTFDPLDPVALAMGVVPGALGAKFGHAPAKAPTPGAVKPLFDMGLGERQALKYNDVQLDAYAIKAAQKEGIPPEVLLAVKNAGERSASTATSPKGAQGVMQFMPDTFKQFGRGDATDPINSIDAGAKYLKKLHDTYGDWDAAIAHYNGGGSQAALVRSGGVPSFPETAKYLANVKAYLGKTVDDHVGAAVKAEPDLVAAARVQQTSKALESSRLTPVDDLAGLNLHLDAVETAADQLGRGERVSVSDILGDRPMDPERVADLNGTMGSQHPDLVRGPDLSAEHRAIETEAYSDILRNPAKAVDDYLAKNGNTIDPDLVKEVFPKFVADRSLAAAVHEPSSFLAKLIYAEALKRNAGKPVIFTAGGGGSGKSEAMPIAMHVAGIEGNPLVYDSTLSSFGSAVKKIDAAKASGAPVNIVYTNRHVEGAFKFAMGRSRVVPAKTLAGAHVGASDTIRALDAHYKDDPNVTITVVNNHGAREDMHLGKVADVFKYEHNQVERRLYDLANHARDSGAITSERHSALLESGKPESGGSPVAGRNREIPSGAQGKELGTNLGRDGSPQQSADTRPSDLSPKAFPFQGHGTVAVTERGTAIKTRYVLVESKSLVTSHDNSLKPNPKFPAELQPRDRARAASEAQISKIENGLNPELLAESPKVSDGAPIIGSDKVVESGNARTIALRRAYAGDKADAYKAWLTENAKRFGLDPKDVAGMKEPVLARVRETPVDRAEFARQANESSVAHMSSTEVAQSDSARMPDLSELHTGDDGSINMGKSMGFIRAFLSQAVSPSERGGMMTAAGELSQDGVKRIRNAVFAKAYGDPDIVAMMGESTDANVKNILNGMMRAAPEVARMRDLMESGARHPMDIAPNLVRAVREFSNLRSEGKTVEQHLAQGSMFGDGLSPEVSKLLQGLQDNARAPKRIAEMITKYTDMVEQLGDPRQRGVFDDPVPAPHDLLTSSVDEMKGSSDLPASAEKTATASDSADPLPQSAIDRAAAEVSMLHPDMMVQLDGMDSPVRVGDLLDAVKAEAAQDVQDGKLVEVAVTCALRN